MLKLELGSFSLVVSSAMLVYSMLVGSLGAVKRHTPLCLSAKYALYFGAVFSLAALFDLAGAFLAHDYRYLYVWQTSNNDMHWMYLISAIWGGMDGSMLLWAAMMASIAAVVVWRTKRADLTLIAWLVPVLAGATGFFVWTVTFLTNPFRFIPNSIAPADGNGLNPLLQNPLMLAHPPLLYAGFTGFAVPFAFAFAALLSGKLGVHWAQLIRQWTLVAWGFLTAGIILGGLWAYVELGWGGFWAWDPVENASFLPWLTGTAFLHSVMVQERRGMLKVWNLILAILTYMLTVFGTFLTRSGVVQSVHAFAESDVGEIFLFYLFILLIITVGLLIWRWKDLKPEHNIESFFSRETAFLLNNLLLVGICFATFWGVMFPVFSEALTGEKSVVGPPFFNAVNVPLFLLLVFLMGIGPLIAWRKAARKQMIKLFLPGLVFGSLITLLFLVLDPVRFWPALSFGLAGFVLVTSGSEVRRSLRARKESTGKSAGGVVGLYRRNPRKYGGLLVHFGVVVMAIAITASMAYKIEKDFVVSPGERYQVGNYTLELERIKQIERRNYTALTARVAVYDRSGDVRLSTLRPERRFYPRNEETTAEVDIRVTPREDLYLALAGLDLGPETSDNIDLNTVSAAFKVFVNPLQVWLWVGSFVVFAGTLLLLWPGQLATLRQSGSVRENRKPG